MEKLQDMIAALVAPTINGGSVAELSFRRERAKN
jgi:hypothetical protein